MGDQMIFKRYELKFMLTKEQRDLLLKEMEPYMIADEHGKSTIQSLYFDTPDWLLVRRSLERPVYKEKLRLRSYGLVKDPQETVFLELKKKYQDVVYKRRTGMSQQEAVRVCRQGQLPGAGQVEQEIDYTFSHYPGLAPKMMLSYRREAFYGKDDHDFRITFDEDILARTTDLNLTAGIYGRPVVDADCVLMEIKVARAIPLWLTRLLSREGIYKTSFSKYGTAYRQMLTRRQVPEQIQFTERKEFYYA